MNIFQTLSLQFCAINRNSSACIFFSFGGKIHNGNQSQFLDFGIQTIDESSSGRSLEIVDTVHDILLVRAIKDFYDERVPSSYLA